MTVSSRLPIYVIPVLLLLTACSSSWKAPLYSQSVALNPEKKKQSSYKPGSRYYKVVQGDTLYGIAWETGNRFDNLIAWNRLRKPYTIYPGQNLLVKAPRYQTPKPKPSTIKTVKQPTRKIVKAVPKQTSSSKVSHTEKFKSRLHWSWPVKGSLIQGYSYGDTTKKGVMLSGKVGDPVKAAESGKVVYSGSGLIGYGKLIIIKHNNKYLSAYGFNRDILVKEGAWVTKGEKIASMGQGDKGVPALHFEIRKNGSPVNPSVLLPRRN